MRIAPLPEIVPTGHAPTAKRSDSSRLFNANRAHAVRYETSEHRTLALAPWIDYYNRRRPHGALQPPSTSHAAPSRLTDVHGNRN